MNGVKEKLFWTKHALFRSRLTSYFYEVEERLGEKAKGKSPVNLEALQKILLHAQRDVRYYKPIESPLLDQFPVINKNIFRENFDSLIANGYEDGKLYPMVTSGSTGTPFRVFQDKEKRLRTLADTLYFSEKAGYRIGDELYYLKIFAKGNMKSRLSYFLESTVPVDVIKLSDDQIEQIFSRIEKRGKDFFITGYSSALKRVAKFICDHNQLVIGPRCRGIVSTAESLDPNAKAILEKSFSCQIFSRYSNLENGIIAQQVPSSEEEYLVNTASFFVEVLDLATGEPVTDGSPGRIVVTDFYNFAMPMIRYDTGDVGRLRIDSETGFVYLSHVEGRKLDLLFDTGGNLVSSYIVYKNMWKYTEIRQYQLIQRGAGTYTLKLNTQTPFQRERALVGEFKRFLGDDARFEVVYVDEIPLLSSGKRRFIVNEMEAP